MIIGEWKPVPELVGMLRDRRKILLVGCACCMAECAAGGKREVETLAPLLRMALLKEGVDARVRSLTLERQCEFEFVEELSKAIEDSDAILSLACGIGVQAVAERFFDLPVYPGLNTTALAVRQEPGIWESRCAVCGDCVLGETFGLCPVARCSKSLSNGPCGGTRKSGKCEVDGDTDCIWTLIVKRAKERGELESLSKIRKIKDWSNSRHGGPKKVVREDLRL